MCFQVWIVVLTAVLFISELFHGGLKARLDKGVCTGLTGTEWEKTHSLSIGRVKAWLRMVCSINRQGDYTAASIYAV